MRKTIPRLPYLHFVYITIVLAALVFVFSLSLQNIVLEKNLLHWQNEAETLKEELNKINRYSAHYQTTPEIVATVLRESEQHKVKPTIMLELIHTESEFQPEALSPDGAKGLCQIRPVTAKLAAQELGLEYKTEFLLDAEYSIKLGTYHLATLINYYDQDYHRALTAYNRGIKGLTDYIKRTGTAISSYSSRISENSLALAQ